MTCARPMRWAAVAVCAAALLAGCRTLHDDWRDATERDTKGAYLSFLRRHPDTEYNPQLPRILARYATIRADCAIPDFERLGTGDGAKTSSRVRLKQVPGRAYCDVKGSWEVQVNPVTGRHRALIWNPGAEHTLLGTLTIRGFTFFSDAEAPLVFKMVRARGYVYQRGKGIIVTPVDRIIRLGAGRESRPPQRVIP